MYIVAGEFRLPSTLITLGPLAFKYEDSITRVFVLEGLDLSNAEDTCPIVIY